MGCACKVGRHISNIEKQYGSKAHNSPKTHITERAVQTLKKIGVGIILIPFFPIAFVYVVGRSFLTKSPLKLYNIFKIKS